MTTKTKEKPKATELEPRTAAEPKAAAPAPPAEPTTATKPAERPKPLMSSDRRLTFEEPTRMEMRRGPMTGSGMSDGSFVLAFATPEELAGLRKQVEERRAKPQTWIYQECDNPKCGLVLRVTAESADNGPCIKCNWQRRADGGHFRTMTDQKTNEYLYQQATKEKLAQERDLKAELYRVNASRGQKGLAPWTLEEFLKQREIERRVRTEQDRQLAEVGRLYRPGRKK